MRRLLLTALLLAVTLPAGGAAGQGAAPALLTYVASNGGICVVRADGTHAVRVTPRLRKLAEPTWSPHGRYLAFDRFTGYDSSHDPITKIGVADDRGRLHASFGSGSNDNSRAAWAPDGRHLAYFARAGKTGWFAAARPDGSHDAGLAGCTGFPVEYCPRSPTWSADGRRLAFEDGGGSPAIWSVRFDGRDRRLLVAGGGQPAFAPVGAKLAYVAPNGSSTEGSLFVADADGGNARPLTSAARDALSSPRWSPGGASIAFLRTHCETTCAADMELVVARADGSRTRVVAKHIPWQGTAAPAWSPDGHLIAFLRGRSVIVAHSDGGGERTVVRRVGSWAGLVSAPSWRAPTPLRPSKRPACPLR